MIKDDVISVKSDSSKSVTYADLAAGKHAERDLDPKAPLKDPANYSVVGQSFPRVDVPFKVDGAMKYGYDWMVEGMAHGRLVRPPAIGAKLESLDLREAAKMPGVVGVFQDGDFAGVAADWSADANEIYDLVGVRLRQLLFTPDRVLAALNAK